MLKRYVEVGVKPREVVLPNGASAPMVQPALDHPPLFSLIAAGFARATGCDTEMVQQPDGTELPTWEFPLAKARVLSLLLFAVSFCLLFAIAQSTFGFHIACLAALFYGTISHIVFHSRLVVTENLTTPLFLGNTLLVLRYVEGEISKRTFGALTIILTAAALLSKLVAVSQAAAVIVLLLSFRKRRDVMFPIIGVILGGALYAAYGWWQGWEIFRVILSEQGNRFCGFGALPRMIAKSLLVHDESPNFLLMVGWAACFACAFERRRGLIFAAPLMYLLSFAFFTAVPNIWGWHLLPFYPFLCLALSVMFVRVYRSCRPIEFLALVALFLPAAFDAVPLLSHGFESHVFRYIYLATVATLVALVYARRSLPRSAMRAVIVLMIVLLETNEVLVSWTHHQWN